MESLNQEAKTFLWTSLSHLNFERHLESSEKLNVFQATNNQTKKTCEVRQWRSRNINLKRFHQRVSLLASCKHPCLVEFLGWTDSYPYSSVFEFPGDQTLFNMLHKRQQRLDPTQKSVIAISVAYAMNHLHEKRIVHGGISSKAVFINQDILPKLFIPFCAHLVENEGNVLGRPNYFAPERFNGMETLKSDVFAYGIFLMELFTGVLPFAEKTFSEIAGFWATGQQLVVPDTGDAQINELISSCLKGGPDVRPSFADIVALIERKGCFFPGCDQDYLEKFIASCKKAEPFDGVFGDAEIANTFVRHFGGDGNYDSIGRVVDLGLASKNSEMFMREALLSVHRCEDPLTIRQSLLEVLYVLAKDKRYVDIFVQERLYELIDLDVEPLIQYTLSIFIRVFDFHPEVATTSLVRKIVRHATVAPLKVLRLFSILCQCSSEIGIPWDVADFLLLQGDLYFKKGLYGTYVEVIYFILSKQPEFRSHRSAACIEVFRKCLVSDDIEVIKKGYVALYKLKVKDIRDPQLVLTHFRNEQLRDYVFAYLTVAILDPLPVEIVDELMNMHKKESVIVIVLWRLAYCDRFVDAIIRHSGSFLMFERPDMMKLLIILMTHSRCRDDVGLIANLPELLTAIVNSGNEALVSPMSTLIRRLNLTGEFLEELNACDFFASYITFAERLDTEASIGACCLLLDHVMRKRYYESYTLLLPAIIKHLDNPKLQSMLLGTIALFSSYSNPEIQSAVLSKITEFKVLETLETCQFPSDLQSLVSHIYENFGVGKAPS